jgi:uncharacterized membrane protein
MWPLIRFDVVGTAWQLYKRHWVIWSLATLIVMIGDSIVTGALDGLLKIGQPPRFGGFRLFLPASGALLYIVSTMVTAFFVGGMFRMACNQVRGRAPRLEDLFSVTDCWFDLLLFALLASAATALGFMFCVVPGFIVFGLFMLGIPLVVEGRLPATGALIQSWEALKSQWLTATLFHVFLILVSLSGVFLCFVGLLLTGPLYSLSIALLYNAFFPAGPIHVKHKAVDPLPEI